jgi:hypothetical protein
LARIGLYSTLIILGFGVVAPFFIFKLCRWIGFRLFLTLTFSIGVLYGIVKADYPWYGKGIVSNAAFMAACGLVLAAYVVLSYGAVGVVARAVSTLRR